MPRTKKVKQTLYCVIRLGWRFMNRHFDRLRDVVDNKAVPAAAGVPVAVFRERSLAEAKREELEREARATLSPFVFVEPYWLHDYAPFHSEEDLLEAVKALTPGLEPPQPAKYSGYDWLVWWERTVARLTDEQREKIWQLLDKVHFYEVVESTLEAS